jgi:histone H3/H4
MAMSAIYLFCLGSRGLVPPLEGTGIDVAKNLQLMQFFDVTAIVCEVSAEEFTGPSGEEKLQDLEWVAPRAVRHEQVIEEVMRYSPVLPARFGSLFSGVESLALLIERNLNAITTFLEYATGKHEWSVKGFLSKTKALEEIISEKMRAAGQDLSSLNPGMRYFKERQIRGQAEQELAGRVREMCDEVSEELIRYAASARRRKVIAQTKEEDVRLVVNWAFLLDRSVSDDFLNRVESVNALSNTKGVSFACSGPWPPYSFAPSLLMEPDA